MYRIELVFWFIVVPFILMLAYGGIMEGLSCMFRIVRNSIRRNRRMKRRIRRV